MILYANKSCERTEVEENASGNGLFDTEASGLLLCLIDSFSVSLCVAYSPVLDSFWWMLTLISAGLSCCGAGGALEM